MIQYEKIDKEKLHIIVGLDKWKSVEMHAFK